MHGTGFQKASSISTNVKPVLNTKPKKKRLAPTTNTLLSYGFSSKSSKTENSGSPGKAKVARIPPSKLLLKRSTCSKGQMSLNQLPTSIIAQILYSVDIHEDFFVSMPRVCKRWRDIVLATGGHRETMCRLLRTRSMGIRGIQGIEAYLEKNALSKDIFYELWSCPDFASIQCVVQKLVSNSGNYRGQSVDELYGMVCAFDLLSLGGAVCPSFASTTLRNQLLRALSFATNPLIKLSEFPLLGKKLTAEQRSIVNCNFTLPENSLIKVKAFAGSGKTTVLRELASKWPDTKFLYLVFNAAMCVEAQKSFPRNVECLNIHKLAYRRMNARRTYGFISNFLSVGKTDFGNASRDEIRNAMRMLEEFMKSDYSSVRKFVQASSEFSSTTALGQIIWDGMADRSQPEICMTHSGYLKRYQLSKPDLTREYACIMMDEAQDCNDVILDIFMSQDCPRILVGDSHQQIYSFMGSINVMTRVHSNRVFRLSQSFRFGAEIAEVCNRLLAFSGEVAPLVGTDSHLLRTSFIGDVSGRRHTYIARSNIGVLNAAFDYVSAGGTSIGLVGQFSSYDFDIYRDVFNFMHGDLASVKNKTLLKFRDMDGFKLWCSRAPSSNLAKACEYVESHPTTNFDVVISTIKSACSRSSSSTAMILLTNVHKAKGQEFEYVRLANDFIDPTQLSLDSRGIVCEASVMEELNLLYVACSRARKGLQLNFGLQNLFDKTGSFYRTVKSIDRGHSVAVHGTCFSCGSSLDRDREGPNRSEDVVVWNSTTMASRAVCLKQRCWAP